MRFAISIALTTAIIAVPAGAASAANFQVNSTGDAGDDIPGNGACAEAAGGPTPCTLRAAVQETNALAGDDVIRVPAGDYQLTGAADEDAAATGDLDLDISASTAESVTIIGAGARGTRILGTGSDRVFHVQNSLLTVNMSGVTVSGGGGVDSGGGILADGVFNLSEAAISGNQTDVSFSQGGGLFNQNRMSLTNVTISGNTAIRGPAASFGPQGAGLFDNGVPSSTLTNVTISGNQLSGTESQGGGMFYNADSFSTTLNNVTIAGNTAPADVQGAGIFINDDLTFANTIVANNRANGVASNCFDNGTVHTSGHNLEEGSDCNFTGPGDLRGANPLLGPLQDNGGQTNTQALPLGSPAVGGGDNALCAAADQRGVARPQSLVCDIGAFELAQQQPPQNLDIDGDGVPNARDACPTVPAATDTGCPLSRPRVGRTVNVRRLSGVVLVGVRGGLPAAGARASQKGVTFIPLQRARQIPVGAFLNTRRGRVSLTSARDARGRTQNGSFASGLFQVLQSRRRAARGLTDLVLKGGSFSRRRCGTPSRSQAAALRRRTVRRLRSNARGRFRTRGRHSAATVRGTAWETADRCDGTLTRVTRGRVAVRDFRRRKTIGVRAGKKYLARAAG